MKNTKRHLNIIIIEYFKLLLTKLKLRNKFLNVLLKKIKIIDHCAGAASRFKNKLDPNFCDI